LLVRGRPFQPSLLFEVRPGAYTKVEHLKGASLEWAMTLLSYIILVCEGMPMTETIAYCENSLITAVKSLIPLAQN
jgi:hypothetical protein